MGFAFATSIFGRLGASIFKQSFFGDTRSSSTRRKKTLDEDTERTISHGVRATLERRGFVILYANICGGVVSEDYQMLITFRKRREEDEKG